MRAWGSLNFDFRNTFANHNKPRGPRSSNHQDKTKIINQSTHFINELLYTNFVTDPSAAKEGYSARSYIWALEEGLILIYKPLRCLLNG
jgi:hypothetical protein